MGDTPFEVGKTYLIRTVTYANRGTVKEVKGGFIVLENAAWIADTGPFAKALETNNFHAVEMFPRDVIVSLASIVDATELKAPQKPTTTAARKSWLPC